MGIGIVIATGRSIISAVEIINELDIHAYVIALNGTFITKVNKNETISPIRKKGLPQERVKKAFEIAMKENVTFIVSNEQGSDRVLRHNGTELVQEFLVHRPDLHNYTEEQMRKMLSETSTEYLKIAFTIKNRKKLLELQHKLRLEGLHTIFSDEYYIEYLPDNTNKGTALAYLCKYLGCDIKETVAFGDQENDIEMLTLSGLGIAMENAQNHVKETADRITLTNDDSGVGVALNELF